MIIRRHSKNYNFIGDSLTGVTFRWGTTLEENPYYAPWPELADISISNHCSKICNFCYHGSKQDNSFISIDDYLFILSSLKHPRWGNVFQVAIGGGEPLEHPNFIEIIESTIEYGIVPNFTTNGNLLNEHLIQSFKGKIGAVAVSESSSEEIVEQKHKILAESKIKTNIHFVLSLKTLDTAIRILRGEYNKYLNGINGIVFLTYKPTGRAQKDNCLKLDDSLKEFVRLVDNNNCSIRIGFDACFVPLLLHLTKTDIRFIDPCECSYFSVYIDEKLNVKPCSFVNDENLKFNLRDYSMEIIWQNKFERYRESNNNSCRNSCKNKEFCRGKCNFLEEINLCYL